jgi:hypothetical protein
VRPLEEVEAFAQGRLNHFHGFLGRRLPVRLVNRGQFPWPVRNKFLLVLRPEHFHGGRVSGGEPPGRRLNNHDGVTGTLKEAPEFLLAVPQRLYRPAIRDVADIALNHFYVTCLIQVADKLHGNLAAVFRFQRQVFVADIPVLLQSLQHGLIGHEVFERANFSDRLADHFPVRITQEFDQERIHISDASRVNVQNQDAILRRFEQPPITKFGGAERLLYACAVGCSVSVLMIVAHNFVPAHFIPPPRKV